jgi:hypothetical protein
MDLKKLFVVKLLVLMLTLSLIGPAFSQGSGKPRPYTGVIEWVSKDFKYIGIDERKILITPETKVVDAEGKMLKTSDLKPGRTVVIESIRTPGGSTERRITIKK